MGMVSFYFCDAAREAGAVVAAGVNVARIFPEKAYCSKVESASPLRLSSRMQILSVRCACRMHLQIQAGPTKCTRCQSKGAR
jgi:hypothetical protein